MLIEQVNATIARYNLLQHPFYQAWSHGTLSLEVLKQYAEQYYHQVGSFPRFLSLTHAHCPEIKARKVLLNNLVDEELHGTDHPSLWMQFAQGLGASEEAVRSSTALPETQAMVDTYYNLAKRDWRDGLCALYAYEAQVPEVSASKITGLKQHYGIEDAKTLEFFTAHQAYDVEHSQQVANLMLEYVDTAQAKHATEEAAKALWGFLDGMCREAGIHC